MVNTCVKSWLSDVHVSVHGYSVLYQMHMCQILGNGMSSGHGVWSQTEKSVCLTLSMLWNAPEGAVTACLLQINARAVSHVLQLRRLKPRRIVISFRDRTAATSASLLA